jgi:hypothetical protein
MTPHRFFETEDWEINWQDEFDGETIDMNKWVY